MNKSSYISWTIWNIFVVMVYASGIFDTPIEGIENGFMWLLTVVIFISSLISMSSSLFKVGVIGTVVGDGEEDNDNNKSYILSEKRLTYYYTYKKVDFKLNFVIDAIICLSLGFYGFFWMAMVYIISSIIQGLSYYFDEVYDITFENKYLTNN